MSSAEYQRKYYLSHRGLKVKIKRSPVEQQKRLDELSAVCRFLHRLVIDPEMEKKALKLMNKEMREVYSQYKSATLDRLKDKVPLMVLPL